MDHALLCSLSRFFAGLLAGIEFIVRFGVRGAIKVLDLQPQIKFRQALIRAWERLDTLRTFAALLTFGFLLAAS